MERSVGLEDFNQMVWSCSRCVFLRSQLLRQFEFGSSGLFVLSSLLFGPFSVNTQTFIGNKHMYGMYSVHRSVKDDSLLCVRRKGIKHYKSVFPLYPSCYINIHPCHMKGWLDKPCGLCSQQDLLALNSWRPGWRHSCLSQFQSCFHIDRQDSCFVLFCFVLFCFVVLLVFFLQFWRTSGGLPWSDLIFINFEGIHSFPSLVETKAKHLPGLSAFPSFHSEVLTFTRWSDPAVLSQLQCFSPAVLPVPRATTRFHTK